MDFAQALHTLIHNRYASGYSRSGYPAYDLSLSDAKKLERIALNYGFPPEWLANLINFESAGTFNPEITNSIGATGLIQFLRSTATGLGTSIDDLRNMSFSEQLDWVDKYLRTNMYGVVANRGLFNKTTGKVTDKFTQQDLFMIIFYPAAVGLPGFVFPSAVTSENAGITTPKDYTNKALASSTAPFKDVLSFIDASFKATTSGIKKNILPFTLTIVGLIGLSITAYKFSTT